jgi:hypothetical protein
MGNLISHSAPNLFQNDSWMYSISLGARNEGYNERFVSFDIMWTGFKHVESKVIQLKNVIFNFRPFVANFRPFVAVFRPLIF